MKYLYETIENLREAGYSAEMPKYIENNLNPLFKLRPYQINGFENFITYYENEKLCKKPTQVLFHMATGSGKTMMMAGLMIYLYKKGYRNFLFFVNLSNIVRKTKENFLVSSSNKYLFAESIIIDGAEIKIKEVSNFQNVDNDAINICFTTTQGLHHDMWDVKENSISMNDCENQKIVLISDEAHHLNADTKKQNKEEEENRMSWEYTVERIFNSNKENVLLEFTATCDLEIPSIRAEYENKIIVNYPLYKFREDKYSKEIKTLRSDISIMERAISAIVLSQYRLKIFEDNKLAIKPVVLFKSQYVNKGKNNNYTSMDFLLDFQDTLKKINGAEVERILSLTSNDTLRKAVDYFAFSGISFEQLAQELKEDFSLEHCIYANDLADVEKNEMALNNLEDKNNPYRAVFAVDKLNEGWDVLNLFDIVRLYETRQGGKKISKATITEAQLIGRGSRYCPFKISEEQDRFIRKFDSDLDNNLRICEELYYHCQNDSRYIVELNNALKEIGIDLDNTITKEHKIKLSFKQKELYKTGYVFLNKRKLKERKDIIGLLPSIRDKLYPLTLLTGKTGEDILLDEKKISTDSKEELTTFKKTIKEISEINYSIVQKSLCKYPVYRFNTLKSYFPNLNSTREFITNENYLANIEIEITTKKDYNMIQILNISCTKVLGLIAERIFEADETYEGTKEFNSIRINEIFKDKKVNYTNPHDGGIGVSQNDLSVKTELRINLLDEEWFAFEDNYGTSEEKEFVAYFKKHADQLNEKYDEVILLRNERQVVIYSFEGGERFEPDYLLFLQNNKSDGYEQMQIFIEPKGSHLFAKDSWKEKFLLELESNAVPITKFVDDNDYKIWGFHFFNSECNKEMFDTDFEKIK